MLKIISASDPRALGRLLAADPADDAALERRVAAIVADVRRGGDRALVRLRPAVRQRLRRADRASIPRARSKPAPRRVSRPVRRGDRAAPRASSRRVARTQVPEGTAT